MMSHLRSSAGASDTARRQWPRRRLRARPPRPARNAASAATWFRATAGMASAALVSAAVPAVPAVAAVAASRPPAAAHHRLQAVIRRTAGGVPHILARDWTSLGYGYGFAFAQDNLCTMASDYVTVEAQRSRYFGPRASYIQRAIGAP